MTPFVSFSVIISFSSCTRLRIVLLLDQCSTIPLRICWTEWFFCILFPSLFFFFSLYCSLFVLSKSRDRILTGFNKWMKCFSSSSQQQQKKMLDYYFHSVFFVSLKVHFRSGFVDEICLVLTCLHFYLRLCNDASDKKSSIHAANALAIQKWNLFSWKRRSVFAFNERRKYGNCARTGSTMKSERFKLRSHDYNYKYLRFRQTENCPNELFYLLIIAKSWMSVPFYSNSISSLAKNSSNLIVSIASFQCQHIFSSFQIDNERKSTASIKIIHFSQMIIAIHLFERSILRSGCIDSPINLLLLLPKCWFLLWLLNSFKNSIIILILLLPASKSQANIHWRTAVLPLSTAQTDPTFATIWK